MTVFVATYAYAPHPDAMAATRPQRYAFFQDLQARGALLASGQLIDSELGAGMLVIEAPDEDTARTMLDGDPFVMAGLVERRTISAWNPTIGSWV